MAEYIDRESIYKTLAMENPFGWSNDDLSELLRQAKPADVAPVRHGRWVFGKDLPYSWGGQIPKNKYHLYCSECLEQAFNRSEDNDPDFEIDTPYCPNCGALMDKEEK